VSIWQVGTTTAIRLLFGGKRTRKDGPNGACRGGWPLVGAPSAASGHSRGLPWPRGRGLHLASQVVPTRNECSSSASWPSRSVHRWPRGQAAGPWLP